MPTSENGLPMLEQAPAQPTFPQVQVQVSPQGMQLNVILAPGIQLSTLIGEEQMNQISKVWIQTRKDIQDQMRVIEHVRQSKNN